LVIFVDEPSIVDFAPRRVIVGESREANIALEVPYTENYICQEVYVRDGRRSADSPYIVLVVSDS
jgi:hypothetical protein